MINVAFSQIRTLHAFSLEDNVFRHYAKLTETAVTERTSGAAFRAIGFDGCNAFNYWTYGLVFWYGAKLIRSGDLTFVDLFAAIMSLMMSLVGIGSAILELGDQKEGIRAIARIIQQSNEALQSPIDGLSQEGYAANAAAAATEVKGAISLRNVHFHYPERSSMEVCNGYDLEIAAGQLVAFVGPSGGGKVCHRYLYQNADVYGVEHNHEFADALLRSR